MSIEKLDHSSEPSVAHYMPICGLLFFDILSPMEKAKIKAWFLIFRPWSFTATAIPFLVALALVPPTHGIAR